MDRATHCVSRSLVSMLHSSRNKYVCITNLQHIEIIFQNVYTNATEGFFNFFQSFQAVSSTTPYKAALRYGRLQYVN